MAYGYDTVEHDCGIIRAILTEEEGESLVNRLGEGVLLETGMVGHIDKVGHGVLLHGNIKEIEHKRTVRTRLARKFFYERHTRKGIVGDVMPSYTRMNELCVFAIDLRY